MDEPRDRLDGIVAKLNAMCRPMTSPTPDREPRHETRELIEVVQEILGRVATVPEG